ncbi:hypothetical protein AK812_SmicGene38106 [Symbiodinium microadriaticum]|uniref:Uncharacterized protein n=1 Tax=Symbiodinium microadriaticum TaxID=2951 RepID=A0A1Q9CEK6_SYMMI|nr:hypothetical protein AK812_SmicGene38106 [Symbiodinium microadriaticum]
MHRLRRRSDQLCQEGIFRAASAKLVLSSWGRTFAAAEEQTTVDQDLFYQTAKVTSVDVFVSHSWAADRWAKLLAMCFFLNLGTAIKATVAAVILSEIVVAFLPDPSLSVMYFAVMDIPMLAFLLAFFFGHRLTCGLWCPNLWVDRLCVHQTDPLYKSKGIEGLPTFVACSSQLLMLWDQTYFDRLWCMLELSIFVKCRGLKGLRFVPLWLPPWLLGQMLFAYIGSRLLAIAVACAPDSGINDTATYRAVYGDTFQWGVQRCLSYLRDCQSYLVFLVPSVVISVVFMPRKIEGHKLMLENMRLFDIRDAKCALESDRRTIQMQVAELFDGLEEPTVSVALDTESTCESWDDEVALLHSYDPVLSHANRLAARAATGYPDLEACLKSFNEYIRTELSKAIVEEFGSELDLPWAICALTCLPHTLGFIGLSWAGRPLFGKLGFESLGQYLIITMLQYCSLGVLFLPVAHPILLRVMNWLAAGPAMLSSIAAFGMGVLTYSFLLYFDTFAAGAVEAFGLTMHPAFLFAYLLSLSLIAFIHFQLFGRPRWQVQRKIPADAED